MDHIHAIVLAVPVSGAPDNALDAIIPVKWGTYHDFAVQWTTSSVIFAIDGRDVARVDHTFVEKHPVGVWNDRAGTMITDWVRVTVQDNASSTTACGNASSNLVCNPGFEASAPIWAGNVPLPQSGPNWLGFPNVGQLKRVGSPVHGGAMSASVQTYQGHTGAYYYQDLPHLPSNASYELSFWVYPSTPTLGDQQVELITGWDRGHGSVTGSNTVTFSTKGTTLDSWGQNASGPALIPGDWHHMTLRADTCARTVQVSVDGATTMTTSPGTAPPSGEATLLVGQGAGTAPSTSRYYYDDFSLITTSCASAGGSSPTPSPSSQAVVFVHGIMGDYTQMGLNPDNLNYKALLSSILAAGYPIRPFTYYQDTGLAMGHHIGYGCSPQQYTPLSQMLVDEIRRQRALYVDADATTQLKAGRLSDSDILNMKCNSESDLATNAIVLDHFLNELARHTTRITIMVHSMGGAITRGWLAYAQYREDHGDPDPALHSVKTVIFMQGAQQGATAAWLGGQCQVGWKFDLWSLLYQSLCHAGGAELVETMSHLDGLSAAARELVPGSAWYRQTNALPLPRNIHYFNFYSDIRVHPFLKADPTHPIYVQTIHLGDLVMPPGSDDPHAIGTENLNTPDDFYPNGGARFCPAPDCHEWQIEDGTRLGSGKTDVPPYPFPMQIASIGPVGIIYHGPFPLHAGPVVQSILHDGATHFKFGGDSMGALEVNVSDCNDPTVHHLRRLVTQIMDILRDPTATCTRTGRDSGNIGTSITPVRSIEPIAISTTTARTRCQPQGVCVRSRQTASSHAAPSPAVPLVLRDSASRQVFTFYPKSAHRYVSPFSFSVVGAGLYLGQVLVVMTSRTADRLQSQGSARWVRAGRSTTRISIRVAGHVDLALNQATLDIQVLVSRVLRRYHLQTVRVQPRAVQPLVRRVDAAIQSHHLPALYPLLPSFLQTSTVRGELAHSGTHGPGQSIILAMTPMSGGQVVPTSFGYTFYIQPVAVRERSASGTDRTYTSALEFIWFDGGWRFWSSE